MRGEERGIEGSWGKNNRKKAGRCCGGLLPTEPDLRNRLSSVEAFIKLRTRSPHGGAAVRTSHREKMPVFAQKTRGVLGEAENVCNSDSDPLSKKHRGFGAAGGAKEGEAERRVRSAQLKNFVRKDAGGRGNQLLARVAQTKNRIGKGAVGGRRGENARGEAT